jgi:hypothetical protein
LYRLLITGILKESWCWGVVIFFIPLTTSVQSGSLVGFVGASRNIYALSKSQAAIKVLDIFHINLKLIWKCQQSMTKLAQHKTIQLV